MTTTENNKERKKKESIPNDDEMLQPITKVNTKLDKELQEWKWIPLIVLVDCEVDYDKKEAERNQLTLTVPT